MAWTKRVNHIRSVKTFHEDWSYFFLTSKPTAHYLANSRYLPNCC